MKKKKKQVFPCTIAPADLRVILGQKRRIAIPEFSLDTSRRYLHQWQHQVFVFLAKQMWGEGQDTHEYDHRFRDGMATFCGEYVRAFWCEIYFETKVWFLTFDRNCLLPEGKTNKDPSLEVHFAFGVKKGKYREPLKSISYIRHPRDLIPIFPQKPIRGTIACYEDDSIGIGGLLISPKRLTEDTLKETGNLIGWFHFDDLTHLLGCSQILGELKTAYLADKNSTSMAKKLRISMMHL